MADWKPPKFGSPVWIGIPATDVPRSHKFYKDVFDWTFKPSTAEHPETQLKMFDFNPDVQLSGGLWKSPDETGNMKPGRSGVCINWLVEDVEKIGSVIEKSGGKMLCDTQKEGKNGLFRFFEDTEGNMGAVYQFVGA